MIATAFMGYVLPFGQMSLWGATVITNLLSAIPWIGQDIVDFILGGFAINNATLNRFFAIHFILPFVLAALALMHLIALHDRAGSSNPLGVSGNNDRLPFSPYYTFKDLISLFIFIFVLSLFVFFMPNTLGDSENYSPANPMSTPPSINQIFIEQKAYLHNILQMISFLLDYTCIDTDVAKLGLVLSKRNKNKTTKATGLFRNVGNFRGTKMTIQQMRDYFNKKRGAYDPKNEKGSMEEFRELACGFWQAEGYVGGFFRSALYFYPLMTATQLLSDESINFFLRLNNALKNKGSFSITLNKMNKFVIQYKLCG